MQCITVHRGNKGVPQGGGVGLHWIELGHSGLRAPPLLVHSKQACCPKGFLPENLVPRRPERERPQHSQVMKQRKEDQPTHTIVACAAGAVGSLGICFFRRAVLEGSPSQKPCSRRGASQCRSLCGNAPLEGVFPGRGGWRGQSLPEHDVHQIHDTNEDTPELHKT